MFHLLIVTEGSTGTQPKMQSTMTPSRRFVYEMTYYVSSGTLNSTNSTPCYNRSTYGHRAFSVAGPIGLHTVTGPSLLLAQ